MEKKIFSVFDSKVNYFMTPMVLRNAGEAIRAFSDAANDKQTNVGVHSVDFMLFEIGSFNEDTGVITPCIPMNLGVASSYVKDLVSAVN